MSEQISGETFTYIVYINASAETRLGSADDWQLHRTVLGQSAHRVRLAGGVACAPSAP